MISIRSKFFAKENNDDEKRKMKEDLMKNFEAVEKEETGNLPVIDGELFDDAEETVVRSNKSKSESTKAIVNRKSSSENRTHVSQSAIRNYLLLPFIFLTVTLIGGLRLSETNNAFIFLRPALVCLIFAAILIVLFFRARLIQLDGWFSESFTTLKNTANFLVMLTLFAASVQIFNAVLPERGVPFWIVGFCFFWTLWNNLFAEFDVRRLLQSLGGLFGLAFVVKYLILANLAAPSAESWWQSILQNPTQTAFTWLLDLPKYSAGTGYIQFFTLLFYLVGLFLLAPTSIQKSVSVSVVSSDKIS
jgi:hypothetical protein